MNTWRVVLSGRVLAVLFVVSVAAAGLGPPVYAAGECEVLRVGSTNNWLPVAYVDDKTGKPVGIAHDFVRFVGEKLGVPVLIDAEIPWQRVLQNLTYGSLDMAAALYWNRERAELLEYTVPYFTNEARVFVRKDKAFEFAGLEDLIGRTGGIPTGGSFGETFDGFARRHHLKLEGVPTKDQRVSKLLSGRNDYFVQDYLDGMLYLRQHDLLDEIVALPRPVSTTKVYFALSRRSPCLSMLPRINRVIQEAKEDGTLQGIIDSYLAN